MNPFFLRIIDDFARRRIVKKHKGRAISVKEIQKELQNSRIEYPEALRSMLFILLGVGSAGFGLKGFLLPNGFIDGGVTGISLLVEHLSGLPLSIWLIVINVPFMVLGAYAFNRSFAWKSILSILLLAVVVELAPYPIVTHDTLLIAVFGGFFLGLGIGLTVRGGAVIDGTEVLAVFLSRRSSLSIGDIILIFNILIFSFGAYLLGTEVALYAILTYLAASKTMDFVIDGIEEYTGVTIISSNADEIRLAIIEKMGRGCTLYHGKRGFGKRGDRLQPTDIIFTVVTRLELSRLQVEIAKIDEDAFVVMHAIKDTKGGMIKKRPFVH